MFKTIIITSLLIAVAVCFAGCQTMKGVGGDLKWTGEQIEAGAANCTVPPPDNSK